MKDFKHCDKCGKDEHIGYRCEVCGKKFSYEAITVTFGYGHYLDTMDVHFCCNKCAIEWFKNEEKKKEIK